MEIRDSKNAKFSYFFNSQSMASVWWGSKKMQNHQYILKHTEIIRVYNIGSFWQFMREISSLPFWWFEIISSATPAACFLLCSLDSLIIDEALCKSSRSTLSWILDLQLDQRLSSRLAPRTSLLCSFQIYSSGASWKKRHKSFEGHPHLSACALLFRTSCLNMVLGLLHLGS